MCLRFSSERLEHFARASAEGDGKRLKRTRVDQRAAAARPLELFCGNMPTKKLMLIIASVPSHLSHIYSRIDVVRRHHTRQHIRGYQKRAFPVGVIPGSFQTFNDEVLTPAPNVAQGTCHITLLITCSSIKLETCSSDGRITDTPPPDRPTAMRDASGE